MLDDKRVLESIIETMHESLRKNFCFILNIFFSILFLFVLTVVSIDESIQWLHNFERLQELQKQLSWPSIQEIDPKTYIPEVIWFITG